MVDKETFDLLAQLATTKKSSYATLPPSIQLLLIEKFDSEFDIFQESFPFFSIK
jgi:hypothetical protein